MIATGNHGDFDSLRAAPRPYGCGGRPDRRAIDNRPYYIWLLQQMAVSILPSSEQEETKMKKLIAMLLACAMVMGLLAACGGAAPAETKPAADKPAEAPAAEAPAAEAPAEVKDITLKVWDFVTSM